MRFAIWNNKGGVGKTFLSFVLGTELARRHPKKNILLADMCPQANLSEIILGGNGKGSQSLDTLLAKRQRLTIGGYFDERISSPHRITGNETSYLLACSEFNGHLPENLYLLAGDPSMEIQAQVISQIGSQSLPQDSWKNVHHWLKDIISACERKLGDTLALIDCNPSFSAYTELSMVAADQILVPCSSDGSSARAIDNIGALLYGLHKTDTYKGVDFSAKAKAFDVATPKIRAVLLNRSTQYDKRASKAFRAMFDEIKHRANELEKRAPGVFVKASDRFFDIPDNHSVAIVASHLGIPLSELSPGKYEVHDESPQINPEPLRRYRDAIDVLVNRIT